MNPLSVNRGKFWAKVDQSGECWEWQGVVNANGYGSVYIPDGRTTSPAHRVAYLLSGFTIPAELVLDHLCRNRRCVNPAHLEPVTPRENVLRSEAASAKAAVSGVCVAGLHALDGRRSCQACRNARQRERRAERRSQNPVETVPYQLTKRHCPSGHPYNDANTYVTKLGKRMCRECMRQRNRARRRALHKDGAE